MEPDTDAGEVAPEAVKAKGGSTGSRSRDRFVNEYLQALPTPMVEGKVVRPRKKGQPLKRLSQGSSEEETSCVDHPDVPEALSEDEEWLASKGQRRRFMVKLCSDLPTIDEQRGSKKKLQFESEELTQATEQQEKSDSSASSPLVLLARDGLCDAAALSSESSGSVDHLATGNQPVKQAEVKSLPRESADMFADSALTYEDIQEDTQRYHKVTVDEDELKSKGTCNTELVSPRFEGNKAAVNLGKYHDRRGFAFRRRRFSSQPSSSIEKFVTPTATAGANLSQDVDSEPFRNSEVTPTKPQGKLPDNPSPGETPNCGVNETPNSGVNTSLATPPFSPASSPVTATPNGQKDSPPRPSTSTSAFGAGHLGLADEEDEFPSNSLLSNVRRCDVMSDDEEEKQWLINEEREELGLSPIDFRAKRAAGLMPPTPKKETADREQSAEQTAGQDVEQSAEASTSRANSTDSNDDPLAEFLSRRKSEARKEKRKRARRLRAYCRKRDKRERRREEQIPLKPGGSWSEPNPSQAATMSDTVLEPTQMANVSFGSPDGSPPGTTNNEGKSRNRKGCNVTFKTTVRVRTQTGPVISDSDFEEDQPKYALHSPPKKKGKMTESLTGGKQSKNAARDEQRKQPARQSVAQSSKPKKRLRSPPPPPPPSHDLPCESDPTDGKAFGRPIARPVGTRYMAKIIELDSDDEAQDDIGFSQGSIRNAETGEDELSTSTEDYSNVEDEWNVVPAGMEDAAADDDRYVNAVDKAPAHLADHTSNPYHKISTPGGVIPVYDDPDEAFSHFNTLRTPEEYWEFLTAQCGENFLTRPFSYNYHKKKEKESLPGYMQLCVVDSKETGDREEFICRTYPERDYPKELWKEQLRETRSDISQVYLHWLSQHKPEKRQRIEQLRMDGRLGVDLFSDGVPPTRSGSRRMCNQLIRFVDMDDGEDLLCECLHNAVTVVYNNEFRLRSRDYCDGLSEVLDDARFKPRLMIADMVERNALCNKQSQTALYGCDQCIAQSENLHWSVHSLDRPRRDEKSWEEEVPENEATDGGTYFGRKGQAPLKKLNGFQISQQLPVEPMHCLFLGIAKHMIDHLIRSDKYHGAFEGQARIEKTLIAEYSKMRLPTEVQRMPRDFHQTWRANEYKVFMLAMGHRVAELFHEAGMVFIAEAFARFTFIIRALLLPNAWYEAVKERYNINAEIMLFYHTIENVMGTNMMTANYHALSHLPHWRERFRLHLLSAEPAETFYGRNKKNLEERNRHYGSQLHYKSAVNLLRGHYCRRNFSFKIAKKKHRIRDNAILVNREMNVARYTGDIVEGFLACQRYYLTRYRHASLDNDWSLVGLFRVEGLVADRGDTSKRDVFLKPVDIVGKGIVSKDVLSVFTRDMWQV